MKEKYEELLKRLKQLQYTTDDKLTKMEKIEKNVILEEIEKLDKFNKKYLT